MNSFGRLLRISIFGESHGKSTGVIIDGCPAGLTIKTEDFIPDLQRRNSKIRGTTPRKENDIPFICSGVFNHKSTGAPLLIMFNNHDYKSEDYNSIPSIPRPGHVDFIAMKKFKGFSDFKGSGHFSGRMTVGLTAAGVIAKKIILPSKVNANVISIGGKTDFEGIIESVLAEGDSIGGIIECKSSKLPVGLGEPFFDSVESLVSHMVFSIPGVKGIEFGSGFACSQMKGSECNDNIINCQGTTKTNHSGGINGGITNGNEIVFSIAVKPPSSISKKQKTINLQSRKIENLSIPGRHDACFALRVPVVMEACLALVLADLKLIEKSNQ